MPSRLFEYFRYDRDLRVVVVFFPEPITETQAVFALCRMVAVLTAASHVFLPSCLAVLESDGMR